MREIASKLRWLSGFASNVLVGQGASLPRQSGIPGCPGSSAAGPGAQAGLELLGRAGMVAVRVADLGSPAP